MMHACLSMLVQGQARVGGMVLARAPCQRMHNFLLQARTIRTLNEEVKFSNPAQSSCIHFVMRARLSLRVIGYNCSLPSLDLNPGLGLVLSAPQDQSRLPGYRKGKL